MRRGPAEHENVAAYRQGVLTYSLLLGMRGGALDDRQLVEVNKLFNFAVDQVPRLAAGFGGIQRPEVDHPGRRSFPIGGDDAGQPAENSVAAGVADVVRSNFQNNDIDAIFDQLSQSLAKQVDIRLSNVSYQDNAPLMFVDAYAMPGACQIAGRYTVDGDHI